MFWAVSLYFLRSYGLLEVFAIALISRCDNFAFGFTKLSRKALFIHSQSQFPPQSEQSDVVTESQMRKMSGR